MDFYTPAEKQNFRLTSSKEKVMAGWNYERARGIRYSGLGFLVAAIILNFITETRKTTILAILLFGLLWTLVTVWLSNKLKKEVEDIFKD